MAKKLAPPRRSPRRDGGDAFIPDPTSGVFIAASDAESLAEEFIAGVTSAGFAYEDARDELSSDELGGPYLTEDAPLIDTDAEAS
jgi:hypothetical protein